MAKAVKSIVEFDINAQIIGANPFQGIKFIGETFLYPKLEDLGANSDHQVMAISSVARRTRIYGTTVTSGPIIKYSKEAEEGDEYHHFCTPLADHICESVNLYQLEGEDKNTLTGTGYRIITRLGDQTETIPEMLSEMSNVDSTFVGVGVTFAYHKYIISNDIFPNGVSDAKFIVEGAKVYDPRKDTTMGGSGSHRHDDPSTWEYTNNAALVNLDWKRFWGDKEVDISRFDMSNIANEANICDEDVVVKNAQGINVTEKRYTCDGVLYLDEENKSNQRKLLTSCAGKWIKSGGTYYLAVGAYRGPAIKTLYDDDLKAPIRRMSSTSMDERCNVITSTFISKNNFYQKTDSTRVNSEYYRQNRDGGRYLTADRSYSFTQTDTAVQRLNRLHMDYLALGDILEIEVGFAGADCPPGTTITAMFTKRNIVNKEYEVISNEFDKEKKTWSMVVKETTVDLFNDSVTPAEMDLSPNTDIDNTFVLPVFNVAYTALPTHPRFQGEVTWDHAVPNSILRYPVALQSYDGQDYVDIKKDETIERKYAVSDLSAGDYRLVVKALNRFKKQSTLVNLDFQIANLVTPSSKSVTSLPGRIDVEPIAPTSIRYTYQWRYFTATDATVRNLPAGSVLNLMPVIANEIYTIQYRLVSSVDDGNWVSFQVNGIETEYHTWLAYADDANGTGISLDDQGKTYYGLATGRTVPTENLLDPSVYRWILREQGAQGAPGINPKLSNQTHIIRTDSMGNNPNFIGASSTLKVLFGEIDDTLAWTITAQPSSGVSGTLTDTTFTVTGMTVDQGYVEFTASRQDYPTLQTRFSLAKVKDGANGATPTVERSGNQVTITSGGDSVIIYDGNDGAPPTFTQNQDGSVTIENSEGDTVVIPPGETPQLGIDYIDGASGDYISHIFIVTTGATPNTPTGGTFNGSTETLPTGWSDTRQTITSGKVRWISSNRYRETINYQNGNRTSSWAKLGAWSLPAQDSIEGLPGQDGEPGEDGQNADAIVAKFGAQWRFNNSLREWTLSESVNSYPNIWLHVEATGNNPRLNSPNLIEYIKGSEAPVIRVRMRTTSATHTTSYEFYYATYGANAHGFGSGYVKSGSVELVQNEWMWLTIDMSDLTAGGSDWMDSDEIYRLRFDFCNNHIGKHYEFDNLVVGAYGSGDETDYFRRDINTVLELPELARTTFGDVEITSNRLPSGAIASAIGEVGIGVGKILRTNGTYWNFPNETTCGTPFEGTDEYQGVFYVVFTEVATQTRFNSNFVNSQFFAATVTETEISSGEGQGIETKWFAHPNTSGVSKIEYTPAATDIVVAVGLRKAKNILGISSVKSLLKPLKGIDNADLNQDNILNGAGWNDLPESGAAGVSTNILPDSTFEKGYVTFSGVTPWAYIDPDDGEFGGAVIKIIAGSVDGVRYAFINNVGGSTLKVSTKAGDRFKVRARIRITSGFTGSFQIKGLGKDASNANTEYPDAILSSSCPFDDQWHTIEGTALFSNANTDAASFYVSISDGGAGTALIDTLEIWKIPASIDNGEVDDVFIRDRFGWTQNPDSGATRNTGALADLDNVDLGDASRVTGKVRVVNAVEDLRNERLSFGSDGYLTWLDQYGQPVNIGNVTINGLGYSGALNANHFELDDYSSSEGQIRYRSNAGNYTNVDVFSAGARTQINRVRANQMPNDSSRYLNDWQGISGSGKPVDSATRNTGALADLDAVDLSNASRVTGKMRVVNAVEDLRNSRIALGSDGYMSYQDENGDWVNLGAVNKGGLGLGNVEDYSRSQLNTYIIDNAKDDQTLRNGKVTGPNVLPNEYVGNLDPHPPLSVGAELETPYFTDYDYDQPDGSSAVYRLKPTGNNGRFYLGRSSSDYNINVTPNSKWLVRLWGYARGSYTNKPIQVYLKTSDGNHHVTTQYTGAAYSKQFYEFIINLSGNSSRSAILRLDNDAGAGNEFIIGALSMHRYVEDEVDRYNLVDPLFPRLRQRSQFQIPMVNTAGALATMNVSPLSSEDEVSTETAKIEVAAHVVQLGDSTVSYNSGSITGLPFNTKHYVYCDDEYYQGGSVNYYATTNLQLIAASTARRYIASITTASNGGGGTVTPPEDCVASNMYLFPGIQAKDARIGDPILGFSPKLGLHDRTIKRCPKAISDCVLLTTQSGAQVLVSVSAPIDLESGVTIRAPQALGCKLLTETENGWKWDECISVELHADIEVVRIGVDNNSYAAGVSPNQRIITHNPSYKP